MNFKGRMMKVFVVWDWTIPSQPDASPLPVRATARSTFVLFTFETLPGIWSRARDYFRNAARHQEPGTRGVNSDLFSAYDISSALNCLRFCGPEKFTTVWEVELELCGPHPSPNLPSADSQ
eukprot:2342586-Heterocapsa_arctica.AAC.1